MPAHFITATDTGAGKTYVTRLLLESLCRRGHRAVGFKPFCCGNRDDALHLLQAGAPGFALDEINPIWLKTPASPLAASWIENRPLDLEKVLQAFTALQSRADIVLVEGVGGWEAPITEEHTVGDFARLLAAQAGALLIWIVVNNKLGALNHTLLTARAIRDRNLTPAGLILNHVSEERDPASISHRMIFSKVLPDVPVVSELIHGESELSSDFILP